MRGERIPGSHRPASETPFDGLGSSRELLCENSLNFRGINMGLYRGCRGGGGLCPQSSLAFWIRVCMRIVPLCVCVYVC